MSSNFFNVLWEQKPRFQMRRFNKKITHAILFKFGPFLRNSTRMGWTDQRMDRQNDWWTDTPSYRGARTHLKINFVHVLRAFGYSLVESPPWFASFECPFFSSLRLFSYRKSICNRSSAIPAWAKKLETFVFPFLSSILSIPLPRRPQWFPPFRNLGTL